MKFETVSVIGLGYIGLPTAAILASRAINVIGVDVNEEAVNTINSGGVHIVEPDLDIIVRAAVSTGNLRATTSPEPAQAFMVAVPTPFKGENHEPDLSYIEAAAYSIAPVLECGNLIILESTSPVGTTEKLSEWLKKARPDLKFPQDHGVASDIRIAHCPERVLPGSVLQELVANDRVIGGMTPACSDLAIELYKTFVKADCISTSARTAEMAKLTENSFRDVNIAFANELSLICDELEINVWELIALANRHPRVNILNPGPGVGGHCIAVDPWFIVNSSPVNANLIKQARTINDSKPMYIVEKVERAASLFKEPTIACLGLSFKADIDDLRESPAVQITEELARRKMGRLLAVEPNINSDQMPDSLMELEVKLSTLDQALKASTIIVVLVDHSEFRRQDWSMLSEKVVIDSRGIAN